MAYLQGPGLILRQSGVSLSNYEPEYLQRAVAFWADPRISGRYFINSGARSYLQQVVLYAKYLAGGTLAAKPNTSNHEYGAKGHLLARAADVNPMNGGSYAELHAVAYEYGFHFPIPSELWHMEMRPDRGPLPNTSSSSVQEDDDMPQPFTLMAPSGRGRWTLFPDGHVETTNFDDKNPIPFHGSMFDFPNELKPGRVFTNLQMKTPAGGQAPSDADGYWIFSADKGAFGFRKP